MIDSIRLNSMPTSLLVGEQSERNDLIYGGRLLMREYNGRMGNKARKNSEFVSDMDERTYKETNEKLSQKTFMYAAKLAAASEGMSAPESYSDFLKNQKRYLSNPQFLRVLSGLALEVLTPTLPYVSSNALGELAQTATIGMGETYEVTIKSNDAFVFQDTSWGASRSVPKNYLYDNVLTANPRPRACGAKIKWYQLVGNQNGGADIGRYYNAMAAGISNKILALWQNIMTSAATNAAFVPAYLRFNTYTTANLIAAAKAVSMANGVPRTNLMGFGDLTALSKVLPNGTAQDAALTTLLGGEWFSRGFIGAPMGIPLTELTNAYVAGTVNLASPTAILPTNVLYIAARGDSASAPIHIVYEDSPITLEMTPDRTGDMSIDINMQVSVDVIAVFAQKMAVISNV